MFNISEIADKAFNNECQILNLSKDIVVTSVDHDSRRIKKGALYVAIKGANQDGHRFIADAVKAGAVGCLVEDAYPNINVPQIVVKDSIFFYGELAKYWRKKITCPVVAITGSNGKTTTKEMIIKTLSVDKHIEGTKSNFNNLIGLPYTILSFPLNIEMAIVEMGMNNAGEIYRLSDISDPDIGVITNIGKAHIGYLGSIEAVFKAKIELFDYMLEHKRDEGVFVMNVSDPMIKNWVDRDKLKHVINFSCNKNIPADVKLLIDDKDSNNNETKNGAQDFSLVIDDRETIQSTTNLKGDYNLCNICCAVAVGLAIGIKASDSINCFRDMELPDMRSKLIDKDGIKYFLDCYNANPDSMLSSIKTVVDIKPAKRLVAVLGDMLELGEFSNGLHYEVGKQVAMNGYDYIFALGDYANDYIDGFLKNNSSTEQKDNATSYSLNEHERLRKDLKSFLKKGDIVLVKGSRGIKLELVLSL